MKIIAHSLQGSSGLSTVIVEHRGEQLIWDVSKAYSLAKGQNDEVIDPNTIFSEINSYWAKVPHQDRLDNIFESFKTIRSIFDSDYDLEAVMSHLREATAKIYQNMPMGELRHHVEFKCDVQYPSTVHESLDAGLSNRRPEQTYIRSDYLGLATLAVALRPMVPIWGEFVANIRREVGNNSKEAQAFRLLYNSHIGTSPEMERLREFIAASISSVTAGDKTFIPILRGLGTVEMPTWLMAMTCVRKLSAATVSGPGDQVNLIAKVHFFVESRIKSLDRDYGRVFGGKISEKKKTGGGPEEGQPSVAEMYKIKPDISDGDIVSLNVYAEDPQRMMAVRCPEAPPEYLEQALESAYKISQEEINQVWLTKLMINPVIPARGVDHLRYQPLLNCMAVAQATLWHWGLYDLAALVTSIPLVAEDGYIIGSVEARARIPKEHMKRLELRYPYALPVKKNLSVRQTNIAARAVETLAEILSKSDWALNAPPALLAKTSRIGNSRTFTVPVDLKVQLANLYDHPQFK